MVQLHGTSPRILQALHQGNIIGFSTRCIAKDTSTGWWFGCHFLNFPIYWVSVIIPIDEVHHFSEGFFPNHQPDVAGRVQVSLMATEFCLLAHERAILDLVQALVGFQGQIVLA